MWKQREPGTSSHEEYALRLLARGPLPVAALRLKLAARGASEEEGDELIGRLQEGGYLDDRAYALLFVDSKEEWGRLRLRDELRRRGVAGDFIREALEEVDEETRAAALVADWLPMGADEKKIMGRLLRRGFSFSTCKKVIERACDEGV